MGVTQILFGVFYTAECDELWIWSHYDTMNHKMNHDCWRSRMVLGHPAHRNRTTENHHSHFQ